MAIDEKPPEEAAPANHRVNPGWLKWTLIFLVVYIVSIGPAFRLMMNGNHSSLASCVGLIYTPLFALGRVATRFGQFLFWYLDLWGWRPAFA